MTTSAALIEARGAGRSFGARTALRPSDLVVAGDETLALVGPNGAGKSTLLALLAGALQPTVGEVIRRDGIRVGWVPQRPAHYARLTPRENLELFARLEGRDDAREAATQALAEFSLPDDDDPAASLSVGNRQRLNIAIALLGDPDVLLLDEPTAALDPTQRRRLWEIVARVRDAGGAVCFATQNVDELERHADRVAALRDGALLFVGGVDEYEREYAGDVFA